MYDMQNHHHHHHHHHHSHHHYHYYHHLHNHCTGIQLIREIITFVFPLFFISILAADSIHHAGMAAWRPLHSHQWVHLWPLPKPPGRGGRLPGSLCNLHCPGGLLSVVSPWRRLPTMHCKESTLLPGRGHCRDGGLSNLRWCSYMKRVKYEHWIDPYAYSAYTDVYHRMNLPTLGDIYQETVAFTICLTSWY